MFLFFQADSLDEKLLCHLAFTSQGCFSPLAASLGGIVGQEVLKALTGKYTPLKQWVRIKIKNCNKDNKPLHKVGECTYH